ncbi:thioredoxin family protein [Sulfurimonas sp.]|jgi:small redox-active disulfide protein 2|uniref:thioredoxin family protein n=1 Tax=Sulfurimonas sp. TaxID=2022749 RepID=UPI0025FD3010|nr:thioredoxin family protein [Sulfurimonas sp.]MBT5933942.1 thioredoxin family protein [Sulfurimonas sp.]
MKIEVLGTGCKKCTELENVVKMAIAKSGKFVQLEKVDDIMKIMAYQVVSTPGLVIDGKVVSTGKVLSIDEVLVLMNG